MGKAKRAHERHVITLVRCRFFGNEKFRECVPHALSAWAQRTCPQGGGCRFCRCRITATVSRVGNLLATRDAAIPQNQCRPKIGLAIFRHCMYSARTLTPSWHLKWMEMGQVASVPDLFVSAPFIEKLLQPRLATIPVRWQKF